MIRRRLLVLDCSDDCLQALSAIAPASFASLHLFGEPGTLLRLASRCEAPVVVLPLRDGGGAPTLKLIEALLRQAPAVRIALFLRGQSALGNYVVEAIRAGAAEVLVDGEDWTGIFARLRQRPRPLLDRW